MTAPNRIKFFREQRGWIAEELGRRVGLSGASVGRIERGVQELTMTALHKFALALGVRMTDLLQQDEAVAFAHVIGSLSAKGGQGILDDSEAYLATIPADPRINGLAVVGFETDTGTIFATERQFPDSRDFGATFVVEVQPTLSDGGLSLRKFEKAANSVGYSAETGEPDLRWLPLGDKRIIRTWRALFELRWFAVDAN